MFKDEIVAFIKSLEVTNFGTFIRLDKSTLIIDSTHNKPNIHINEDIWKTRLSQLTAPAKIPLINT